MSQSRLNIKPVFPQHCLLSSGSVTATSLEGTVLVNGDHS